MYIYIHTHTHTHTYTYDIGYRLVWGPPQNNLGILFNVQISTVPGVNNKKSLDKKGFQLKPMYGQLIFFLHLKKSFDKKWF